MVNEGLREAVGCVISRTLPLAGKLDWAPGLSQQTDNRQKCGNGKVLQDSFLGFYVCVTIDQGLLLVTRMGFKLAQIGQRKQMTIKDGV